MSDDTEHTAVYRLPNGETLETKEEMRECLAGFRVGIEARVKLWFEEPSDSPTREIVENSGVHGNTPYQIGKSIAWDYDFDTELQES